MRDTLTTGPDPNDPKSDSSWDLEVTRLPPLNWESGHVAESLAKLRDYTVALVEDSMDWYRKAKRPMKRAGRLLRFGAILLGAVAGMVPVLAELILFGDKPLIRPLWSAIAIGLAAALVLADKFYGYTSAWVRYILVELELQELLRAFIVDWENARLSAGKPEPTPDQALAIVTSCRAFLLQAHAIFARKTQEWAAEFQDLLLDLAKVPKNTGQSGGTRSVTPPGNR